MLSKHFSQQVFDALEQYEAEARPVEARVKIKVLAIILLAIPGSDAE